MINALDTYDWAEVFGEGSGGNCQPFANVDPVPGSDPALGKGFGREDVSIVLNMSEGERDEQSWLVYGILVDGRSFIARGWCDYTGWYCQAGNSADVAASMEDLVTLGMTDEERKRLGVIIA